MVGGVVAAGGGAPVGRLVMDVFIEVFIEET